MQIGRVIFWDLDGTLVESEPVKARAHLEVITRRLTRITQSQVVALAGLPSGEIARLIFARIGMLDHPGYLREYSAEVREHYRSMLECVTAQKGAAEILDTLCEQGYRHIVVTSSTFEIANEVLRLTGLAHRIRAVVSAEHVEAQKPDPAVYRLALRAAGVGASSCVAIEDSDSGVESACRAGLRVLGVRHQWNAAQGLAGVTVLDGLSDTAAACAVIEASFEWPQ